LSHDCHVGALAAGRVDHKEGVDASVDAFDDLIASPQPIRSAEVCDVLMRAIHIRLDDAGDSDVWHGLFPRVRTCGIPVLLRNCLLIAISQSPTILPYRNQIARVESRRSSRSPTTPERKCLRSLVDSMRRLSTR